MARVAHLAKTCKFSQFLQIHAHSLLTHPLVDGYNLPQTPETVQHQF